MNDGTRTFDAEGLPNIRVGKNVNNHFNALGEPVVYPEIHDPEADAARAGAMKQLELSGRAGMRDRLNFHPVSIQLTVPPVGQPELAALYRAMLERAEQEMHPEQYRRLTVGEFVPQRPCHKGCEYHGERVLHVIQCPNAER